MMQRVRHCAGAAAVAGGVLVGLLPAVDARCSANTHGGGGGRGSNHVPAALGAAPSLSKCAPAPAEGLTDAIGDTPLVELTSLSRLTGCKILAKCEHLNPGGSIKDRAAKWLIEAAEASGKLKPGGTVCEGTGGNTGIGLAIVCNAKGYKTVFAMPASIAREKIDTMRLYGAQVILTPGVPFEDERHYFHRAARVALEGNRADANSHLFTNQFENLANSQSHYDSTAPEIWAQSGQDVDGFVCSAGTGGTIGGISRYLKEVNPACQVFLIDPPGSGLANLVTVGESYSTAGPSPSSAVGATPYAGDRSVDYIERSCGSSITEGIGIDRVTANFASARIDGAFVGQDLEAVEMAYFLLRNEGLMIGPSAALNVVGAVKLARRLGPGKTIVTIICDGGERYRTKLFNPEWLEQQDLVPKATGEGIGFVA